MNGTKWIAVGAAVLGVAAAGFALTSGDDGAATGTTALADGAAADHAAQTVASGAVIEVWKSPTCGCCGRWVEHLKEAGFEVRVTEQENMGAVKTEKGVPGPLASCHTAVVDGYVVEGHVPADVIARLLEERPDVAGISVPGMPMGSPGMEGDRKDPYDIVAFRADGTTEIYDSR